MALWASLSDAERDAEFELSEAQRAELDRRWAEHVENPASAVPWSVMRSMLTDRSAASSLAILD